MTTAEVTMRVELLLAPDCPHAGPARAVLTQCLDQLRLNLQVLERVGDYASPTVLVDGIDVMTGAAGTPQMRACRLDLPTASRILSALRGGSNAAAVTSDSYPLDLAVGVTSNRIAEVSGSARTLHKAILGSFAATGHAPDTASLAAAVPAVHELTTLMRELHDRDVIRLDDNGQIRAAYPFSGIPTAHIVDIDGGPNVYAMCAIDALGIADMLRRDTTITSADPGSGQEIRILVHNGQAVWDPGAAVVFVGSNSIANAAGNCCPPEGSDAPTVAAADRCCGVMNFFTSPANADDWLTAHPTVSGTMLTQAQALRLGVDIFGRLLDD